MQIFKKNAQDIAKAFTKYSLWQGGGGGGGSAVTWEQLATEGQHIANITIDGNKTEVYAQSGGSSVKEILFNSNTPITSDITLLKDFSDYDYIKVFYGWTNIDGVRGQDISTNLLKNAPNYGLFLYGYGTTDYSRLKYINERTLYVFDVHNIGVYTIIGCKY